MSLARTLATILGASGTIHAVHGAAPPGVVLPYAGATAPSGWLFCYDQAVSRTTYAALFDAIGTIYGAGDGSATFNIPDMRGRVSAGKDDMGGTAANRLTSAGSGVNGAALGAAGGAQSHTLDATQMPSHRHKLYGNGNYGGSIISGLGDGGSRSVAGNTNATTGFGYVDVNNGVQLVENTGGGLAHNNTQPTIILNYIIRSA